jgi:hypothetical protein
MKEIHHLRRSIARALYVCNGDYSYINEKRKIFLTYMLYSCMNNPKHFLYTVSIFLSFIIKIVYFQTLGLELSTRLDGHLSYS